MKLLTQYLQFLNFNSIFLISLSTIGKQYAPLSRIRQRCPDILVMFIHLHSEVVSQCYHTQLFTAWAFVLKCQIVHLGKSGVAAVVSMELSELVGGCFLLLMFELPRKTFLIYAWSIWGCLFVVRTCLVCQLVSRSLVEVHCSVAILICILERIIESEWHNVHSSFISIPELVVVDFSCNILFGHIRYIPILI